MNLEKLFWSKAKVDILKYLIFKRQGLSMRALENELSRTFPAIKKQIDSLNDSDTIIIDKNSSKRAIRLQEDFYIQIKNFFIFSLKKEITQLFNEYEIMIEKYYFGNRFWINLDMDLIVLYKNCEKPQIDKIKENINDIFSKYFIDVVSVVFMSANERNKRHRLADRFVLNIMRNIQQN